MDFSASYDEDIYAWSQEQAALLRGLAARTPTLPNGLDLEHVAEEIEDVGKSEACAARSFIRLLFIHAIKLASAPEAPAVDHWRSEAATFAAEAHDAFTRAMTSMVDLDLGGQRSASRPARRRGRTPARSPRSLAGDPRRHPRWSGRPRRACGKNQVGG